jgi:hypothetical protein
VRTAGEGVRGDVTIAGDQEGWVWETGRRGGGGGLVASDTAARLASHNAAPPPHPQSVVVSTHSVYEVGADESRGCVHRLTQFVSVS